MIKNAKNFAFGLAVALFFFLAVDGILWISGVEPLYERTDPYVGFSDYSPLFVERRMPDGEHFFAKRLLHLYIFMDFLYGSQLVKRQ